MLSKRLVSLLTVAPLPLPDTAFAPSAEHCVIIISHKADYVESKTKNNEFKWDSPKVCLRRLKFEQEMSYLDKKPEESRMKWFHYFALYSHFTIRTNRTFWYATWKQQLLL